MKVLHSPDMAKEGAVSRQFRWCAKFLAQSGVRMRRSSHSRHPFELLTQPRDSNNLERHRPSSFELAALAIAEREAERSLFSRFQTALLRKLELPYQTSARNPLRRTFRRILNDAGVLNVFLRKSTLEELYKWKLLLVTFRLEARLRNRQKTASGTLLKQHRSLLTELLRHSREIYDIATQRAPFLEISSHLALVRREIVNQVEILIPYQRVQPWRPLFRDAPLNPEPQSPEDATKLRIFSFLQRKLQTTKSRSRGISDSLLKHLTELVASGALNNPRYSGALQKQRKRHPDNRA